MKKTFFVFGKIILAPVFAVIMYSNLKRSIETENNLKIIANSLVLLVLIIYILYQIYHFINKSNK